MDLDDAYVALAGEPEDAVQRFLSTVPNEKRSAFAVRARVKLNDAKKGIHGAALAQRATDAHAYRHRDLERLEELLREATRAWGVP